MSWVMVGIAIASAAASAYNTQQVQRKQDNAAANSIMKQSRLQRQADDKVNRKVVELEGSNSGDERSHRMGEYLDALRISAPGMRVGMAGIGSSAFQGDSAQSTDDVLAAANDDADLLARIDAPVLQRQGEAFGYGNLATDIGLIGRQSSGQQFMDNLRMKSIKRNPWIDAAAQVGMGYASSGAGGGKGYAGKTGQQPYMSAAPATASGGSWLNGYGG